MTSARPPLVTTQAAESFARCRVSVPTNDPRAKSYLFVQPWIPAFAGMTAGRNSVCIGVVKQPYAFWGRPEGRSLYLRVDDTGDPVGLCITLSMRVSYFPGTDSLFVILKSGLGTEGSEVAPGIVFHYTPEGEVTAIDIDSEASKPVDLSSLEVEGLPVNISPAPRQESKAV
jgi:uncharacterized protein YuzE